MRVALVWIVLAGTYVLFVGSFGTNEAIACAASASLAALWWHQVARRGGTRFAIPPGAVTAIARAAAGLPARTAWVAARLAGACLGVDGSGSSRTRPLSASGWPGATARGDEGATGRALGLLAASLAPDSYVLRLNTARRDIVEHTLRDDPGEASL